MDGRNTRSTRKEGGFFSKFELRHFFWCFLVAFSLWLLTALNENYNRQIHIQVRYINYPKGQLFVRPLPDQLKVAVNAKGWDIMNRIMSTSSEDLVIDLAEYEKQNFILTRMLRNAILQQLPQKISIIDIYPDSILLAHSMKGIKRVPIKIKYDASFQKHYQLGNEISYSPDSITISGPAELIEKIDSVNTDQITLKELNAPVTTTARLHKPEIQNINYSQYTVSVTFPVYALTEKTASIPIRVLNAGRGNKIKLIPQRVSLSYQTTLNKYDLIDSSLFMVVADATDFNNSKKHPLKIKIVSQPRFTYNARLKEEFVDYVIDK